MKRKISLALLFFLLVFLTDLAIASALNCVLTDVGNPSNPCPVGECVFSMFQQTDSHAGNCTYGRYKVCCEEPGETLTPSIKFLTDCDSDEGAVLSLFDELDSHVERYQETFYPYHVCLKSSLGKLICYYSTSCNPGEGLASFRQNTDSHVAEYNYYSTKICCSVIPPYDFKIWVDEPRLVTIGKPVLANVYVQNLGTAADSYTITYTKNATDLNLNPAPHLVHVSMPSNRIHSLEPDKIGNTFASITILGPISSGNVTFNVTSETNPSKSLTDFIDIEAGFPMSLPEFGLIGMIELLFLVCLLLVVSYSSHFL